jgi:hypothetical protein
VEKQAAELVDGVVAAIDRVDVVARLVEAEDDDLAKPRVVFGDEHAHLTLPEWPHLA